MRDIAAYPRPTVREYEPTGSLLRIVVALDGTPFAEMALPPAVALGRTYNAEVVLVRAHAARAEPVRTRLGLRRHERETLGRASLYLARIEQDLRTEGVRAVGMSPVGQAPEAIADVASRDGDLAILATHAGQVRPAQISVARDLATRVGAPLLLVSPAARSLFSPSAGTPTIVVALDGERRDGLTLRLVTLLARSFGGVVIGVGSTHGANQPHGAGKPSGTLADKHESAHVTAYLETVRSELARRSVAAWTVLVDGDAIAEIPGLVRVEGSLVVLGMHGTLAQRNATAEAAMVLLRSTGAAVLLVPQGPRLTPVSGGMSAQLARGGL
jgi:hypothetical protein